MISFKSQITIKLLDYFFVNSQARNYINELARIIEVDPGNLSRKLNELEKEGFLSSSFSGNQRYYSLNLKYPLLPETKKIYENSYGLKNLLAKSLKGLRGLKTAYIFGSYAKGNFDAISDIDILLIGEHSSLEAKRLILPLQKRLKRELNIVDLTEQEYKAKQKKKDPFLKNIFNGKMIKII